MTGGMSMLFAGETSSQLGGNDCIMLYGSLHHSARALSLSSLFLALALSVLVCVRARRFAEHLWLLYVRARTSAYIYIHILSPKFQSSGPGVFLRFIVELYFIDRYR
jgi:hypothetical protein